MPPPPMPPPPMCMPPIPPMPPIFGQRRIRLPCEERSRSCRPSEGHRHIRPCRAHTRSAAVRPCRSGAGHRTETTSSQAAHVRGTGEAPATGPAGKWWPAATPPNPDGPPAPRPPMWPAPGDAGAAGHSTPRGCPRFLRPWNAGRETVCVIAPWWTPLKPAFQPEKCGQAAVRHTPGARHFHRGTDCRRRARTAAPSRHPGSDLRDPPGRSDCRSCPSSGCRRCEWNRSCCYG